eukprot:15364672-Ditylum_brightwellii.AAC.2
MIGTSLPELVSALNYGTTEHSRMIGQQHQRNSMLLSAENIQLAMMLEEILKSKIPPDHHAWRYCY